MSPDRRIFPHRHLLVDDIAQLVGGATATAVCWWTSRRYHGVERRWRTLMALGMAGWTLGMFFWAFYRSVLHVPLHRRNLELAAAAAGRALGVHREHAELDPLTLRVPRHVVIIDAVRHGVEVFVRNRVELRARRTL